MVDKIKRRRLAASAIAIVVSVAWGCSSVPSKLVGTWESSTQSLGSNWDVQLVIERDGDLTSRQGASEVDGSIRMDGDYLWMQYENGSPRKCKYSVDAQLLTLLCGTNGRDPEDVSDMFKQYYRRIE